MKAKPRPTFLTSMQDRWTAQFKASEQARKLALGAIKPTDAEAVSGALDIANKLSAWHRTMQELERKRQWEGDPRAIDQSFYSA